MNTHPRKRIVKMCHIQQKKQCLNLVHGYKFVKSLKSSTKRGFFSASFYLCEDFSDLTSPNSNHLQIDFSGVNDIV